jgi:hypothetical protein
MKALLDWGMKNVYDGGREETIRKCSSCFLCCFGDPLCFGSSGTDSYDEVVRVSFLDDKLIVERKLR